VGTAAIIQLGSAAAVVANNIGCGGGIDCHLRYVAVYAVVAVATKAFSFLPQTIIKLTSNEIHNLWWWQIISDDCGFVARMRQASSLEFASFYFCNDTSSLSM